ncbi:GAF domain-containing protein [Gordonia sp. DT30]|uniref:helix-turn-helix domain-containing protein n=1 Tax=unclassified Gordonia (in: high G+C Gram-positive bacteria) TaxID=2657482 RepID=UPI003CF7FAA5
MTSLPIGLEPAVAVGEDPRRFAAVLHAVYDAAMAGTKPPARPRQVISESWDRVIGAGVDPDHGADPAGLDIAEIEMRRSQSGLHEILDELTRGLASVISDGDNILVVADAHGHVLWRSGANRVLHRADRLGFVEGACWAEAAVGTNAIGTALESGRSVQVFSAEHFVRTHHTWTCAGAPIRNPRTGAVLGVVDVSGPAATIHPTTLALVDTVARLAEAQLREHHRRVLDQLRSVAAPIVARSEGPAIAADPDGWVAAVDSMAPRTRLPIPRGLAPGRTSVPGLGPCEVEPLPGGWLIRPVEAAHPTHTTRVVLGADDAGAVVRVAGFAGAWTDRLTPRHAQILGILAAHPQGLRAADLSFELFGVADRTITVRAEISRLRKRFGGLLGANPYRFAGGVEVSDTRRRAG